MFMITFKEYLLEADAKSQETKEYIAKQRDKSKRVKLKHIDKPQNKPGDKWNLIHNRVPEMLKRQSGL